MKNKILLFLFTILTFGIFLVPAGYAKELNASTLDAVNIVNGVTYDDELREITIDCTFNDYFKNSYTFGSGAQLYFTLSIFNTDLDLLPIPSNTFSIYNFKYNDSDARPMQVYNNYFYRNEYFFPVVTNSNQLKSLRFDFIVNQNNAYYYDTLKTCYFQVMAFVGTTTNYPISYNFIGNTYYNVGGYNYRGVFQYTTLDLMMERQGNTGDISDNAIGYNVISLNEPLLSQIANNNNINTYQYYLRLNINLPINRFVNLKFSYLELLNISINGRVMDYATALNSYDFLYSNIVLYNDNATLFVNGFNLLNSSYSDYVIDYIDFRIADYTFKSSNYYNSNIGILGYLENTSISLYEYNIRNIYDNGFESGQKIGYDNGYNVGFSDGINSNETRFDGLMFAIADVPMKVISSMLNFDILGFNLMGFFLGIITLLLFIKLMRKFKE